MTDTGVPLTKSSQLMRAEQDESRRQLSEAQVKRAQEFKMPTNVNAGEEHTLYCQWCFSPFRATVKRSGKFRDSIEYEPLRRLLLVSDHTWEPPICDNCFPAVMGSARAHMNMADRPEQLTNFLLRVQELSKKDSPQESV